MKQVLLSVVLGVLASVVAAYVFLGLQAAQPNWPVVLTVGGVLSLLLWIIISQRFRLNVLTKGGIAAYYPAGQRDYIDVAVRDLHAAEQIYILGARGLDLVGDQSPIAKALREAHGRKTVGVFLLGTASEHGRLRGNALQIEREKYEAECISAQRGVMLLQQGEVEVTLYTYDAQPRIRAIVTETVAYVSLYKPGMRGRDLPAYKLTRGAGEAYDSVVAFIERLRLSSKMLKVYESSHIRSSPSASSSGEGTVSAAAG
jgi:hypothetical protein